MTTPDTIRAARIAAGLTQKKGEAAGSRVSPQSFVIVGGRDAPDPGTSARLPQTDLPDRLRAVPKLSATNRQPKTISVGNSQFD